MHLQRGLKESDRAAAAALFWDAFDSKLGVLLGPSERGERFLARGIDLNYAVVARGHDGRLLGLCGLKTHSDGFIGGDFGDLCACYGFLSALWRYPMLITLDRAPEPQQLLLDGICVRQAARGQGVGAALIAEVITLAREQGFTSIRLEVIDQNPRARALYERLGFELTQWEDLGPFKRLFGFRRVATMLYEIPLAP
ncbi:MAG: GNAT family N-acetyltransferase [Mangrovicoccus sp.]|nr:GNAT family N-acetyltransferase [Mangrovicoccus sp.]